jgi:hypothetical protein
MKQTAVEWLVAELRKYGSPVPRQDEEHAKEMEKQQIINAYQQSTTQFANDARIDYPKTGEQYYNETFNN